MKSIPEKCVILIYYWVPSTEQDILTLPEHLMSSLVFFVVVHTVSASVFVSSCSCAFIFCDLLYPAIVKAVKTAIVNDLKPRFVT
jgi:hypothetical protein